MGIVIMNVANQLYIHD